jgi:hypothetical protein
MNYQIEIYQRRSMPHAETVQAVRMVLQAENNELSAVFTRIEKCLHLSRI